MYDSLKMRSFQFGNGAAPFPNWNERILSECYIANAHAHTMEGTVVHVRNNYESLNVDFGPTLAAWMERHGKPAYRAMRRGDELSAAHALAWDRNRLDGSLAPPDDAEVHHALFLLSRARGLHPTSFDEMRVEIRRRAALTPAAPAAA